MLASSFNESKIYLKKDILFVGLVFFINICLLYVLELCVQSSFSESSEFTISYSFTIGIIQAWTLISLAVRIQSHIQTESLEMYKRSFQNGLYAAPASILYGLIYGFLSLLGCFLFILPGLYAAIALFYAPFLAMFNIEGEDSYFFESIKLVRGNISPTILFLLLFLLTELLSYGISYLGEKQMINYYLSWGLNTLAIGISILIQSWFCYFFFSLLKKKLLDLG